MKRAVSTILCVALAGLPACKIVFDDDRNVAVPVGPDGDDTRNAARLDDSFDSQLVPHIESLAIGPGDLRAELAKGLDAAGQAHGNQGSGRGAAWNFAVRGEGNIVEAKLDTSARTLAVDTDDDGVADMTVQLGPVVRGTALRDIAPFYNFDDFRDQIEFAKLARAINDKVKTSYVVPDGELVGGKASFLGVVPLKAADEPMVLTPVRIEITQ